MAALEARHLTGPESRSVLEGATVDLRNMGDGELWRLVREHGRGRSDQEFARWLREASDEQLRAFVSSVPAHEHIAAVMRDVEHDLPVGTRDQGKWRAPCCPTSRA